MNYEDLFKETACEMYKSGTGCTFLLLAVPGSMIMRSTNTILR